MSQVVESPDSIEITRNREPGFLYWGFAGLGLLIFLISSTFLVFSLTGEGAISYLGLFISFFACVIGLVVPYACFASLAKGFQERICFDRSREEVRITNTTRKSDIWCIPFANLLHVRATSEVHEDNETSYTVFVLYLIARDGAEIWVTESGSQEKLTDLFIKIMNLTGLRGVCEYDENASRSEEKKYVLLSSELQVAPGPFVEKMNDQEGDIWTLKPPRRPIHEILILSVMFLFFTSAPILILLAIQNAQTPWLILAFTYFLMLLWYSSLVMVLLISLKDFRLRVSRSRLRLEIVFKALPFLTRQIDIPSEQVQQVRTNRIAEGHCSLSLGVTSDFSKGSELSRFLLRTSLFSKTVVPSKLVKNQSSVILWTVPIWTPSDRGPSVRDLIWLEKMIEEKLSLKEKDLSNASI